MNLDRDGLADLYEMLFREFTPTPPVFGMTDETKVIASQCIRDTMAACSEEFVEVTI